MAWFSNFKKGKWFFPWFNQDIASTNDPSSWDLSEKGIDVYVHMDEGIDVYVEMES